MVMRTLHLGVGGRGRWPVRLFPTRDDLQPVGLCDLRPEALTDAGEATGLGPEACFDDWRRALAEVACDVVVVITPPQLHYEMCLAAVRAGKHVLVEKPFTMDLGEACHVVREAEAAGVKLAVAQQARYSPAHVAAAELIASGELGAPEFGHVESWGWRPGVHHSGDQPHSYAWERGVHDYDTAWSLFGSPPARVRALSFNPSWSPYAHGAGMAAVMEFASGASCAFTCSYMSHRSLGSVVVECAEGAVVLGGKTVTVERHETKETREVPIGERPRAETRVVDEFVAWLTGGDEPVCGMHHNLFIVGAVEATGLASDEGRVIDIAALIDDRRAG